MRIALSIAGSDPTGGAGMQLDVRVFQAFGVHGAGVLTALTVQDTAKVHRVLPAFPSVVLEQLRTLFADLIPHAVKLGMLATDDVARSVILGLEHLDHLSDGKVPLVIDPVLAASDGSPLLERRAWPVLMGLFPRATLVTPNLPEAEALTGRDVSSAEGVEAAARIVLGELGARAVLIKGGHGTAAPRDLLGTRNDGGIELEWLVGERLPGPSVHGTGCALASAVTAGLALKRPLRESVVAGREFVREAMKHAEAPGTGARLLALPR